MDAFLHFITSNLCFLYLDMGQKGLQKLMGAYSVNSDTWPLSRVRVGHAVASSGSFPCHAYTSVTRTRHLRSAQGRRPRQSRVRVDAFSHQACGCVVHAFASLPFSSKLHFCAFLPFLYVSFLSSKPFMPYEI